MALSDAGHLSDAVDLHQRLRGRPPRRGAQHPGGAPLAPGAPGRRRGGAAPCRGGTGVSPATNGEHPWKTHGKSMENLQILPAKNYAKIWENPSSAAKLYILYVICCRCKLRTSKVFTGEMEEHGKYVEFGRKSEGLKSHPLVYKCDLTSKNVNNGVTAIRRERERCFVSDLNKWKNRNVACNFYLNTKTSDLTG